jgi:hypothetical protein
MFCMINRIHDSLHLDLDDQPSIDKLTDSRTSNERTVLEYVKRMVEYFDKHTAP